MSWFCINTFLHEGAWRLWGALTARQESWTWKALLKYFFLISPRCARVLWSQCLVSDTVWLPPWNQGRQGNGIWKVSQALRGLLHIPSVWGADGSMSQIFGPSWPRAAWLSKGLRSPICNWFESCALQRYCLQKIIPCYASAHGFWQPDFKRRRANFENSTGGFWFLALFPIPKPCSYLCLVLRERKRMEISAEVECKLKTKESRHDLTIIPGHPLLQEPSFCAGYWGDRARRRA